MIVATPAAPAGEDDEDDELRRFTGAERALHWTVAP